MSRPVIVTFLALLFVPLRALASPIYSSIVFVDVSDLNSPVGNQSIATGVLTGVNSITESVSNSKSSATGIVHDGVLGAFDSAESDPTDSAFVSALSQVTFSDTLTLTSTDLAAGTPVDLLLSLDLHAVLASTQTPDMGGGCGSSALGGLTVSSGVTTLTTLEDFQEPAPCSNTSSGPVVISARIGDELTTALTLTTAADGRIGGGSSVDATHTLQFFADPLGDFTYSTASGNSYLTPAGPTPVPEPGSFVLMLTGAIALARRLR